MAETRTMLAELPDPNKLVAFDRNRHVMVTMAENVERATRTQLAELVQLLIERVRAKGRSIEPESDRVDAAGSPVLRASCVAMAPPDGFEPPTQALGRPRSIH